MLYLVPTPIGNLADITLRALDTLKAVNLILAEDTRTTGHLLNHYGINTPMRAYHQHNEHKITDRLVDMLSEGQKLALVTDAGSPGISDPGFLLVRAVRAAGLQVCALPGATALVPALTASGLPSDRFIFEGFLPRKKGRHTVLKSLADETRTVIIYESPYRVLKTLNDLQDHCGPERPAAVAREISKIHEEVITQQLAGLIEHYTNHPPKGECLIILGGSYYMLNS